MALFFPLRSFERQAGSSPSWGMTREIRVSGGGTVGQKGRRGKEEQGGGGGEEVNKRANEG